MLNVDIETRLRHFGDATCRKKERSGGKVNIKVATVTDCTACPVTSWFREGCRKTAAENNGNTIYALNDFLFSPFYKLGRKREREKRSSGHPRRSDGRSVSVLFNFDYSPTPSLPVVAHAPEGRLATAPNYNIAFP